MAEESRSNKLALRSNDYWLNYIQPCVTDNESLLAVSKSDSDLKGMDDKESAKFSSLLLNQNNKILFTLRPLL